LTSHKGIDLHAATALRVMQDRLEDGDSLVGLARAEYVTFWDSAAADHSVADLLALGRYFNPNKHHYGYFYLPTHDDSWFEAAARGEPLPTGWPGEPRDTDWGEPSPDLYNRLLGGCVTDGTTAVDVCTFALGETGPLLSGVLWRLILRPTGVAPLALADRLAVARQRSQGLLVNPHMQGWRLKMGREGSAPAARQAGSLEGT
jgi:hypothetical protein